MTSFLFILPDLSEHHTEIDVSRFGDPVESFASDLIRKSGRTTHRNNAVSVPVQVFKLEIEKGQIKKKVYKTYKIVPPYARMTDEEYHQEMNDLLEGIPVPFQQFIQSMAYEQGHSAGYEEIVLIAGNIVPEFTRAFNQYKQELPKKK